MEGKPTRPPSAPGERRVKEEEDRYKGWTPLLALMEERSESYEVAGEPRRGRARGVTGDPPMYGAPRERNVWLWPDAAVACCC